MTSKNSNLSLYNSKYLKYKNKYLNLSNIYGGGLKEDMERWINFIRIIQSSKDTDEVFLRGEAKYFFRIGWIGPNFPIDGKSFSQIEQPEKMTSENLMKSTKLKKLQIQHGEEKGMDIWLNHVREIDNKFDIFIERLGRNEFNIEEAEHLLNLGWIGPNFPLPGGSFCKRERECEIVDKMKAFKEQPLKVGFNASLTNPQTRQTGINPTRCRYGEECSRYKKGECTFTH